MNQKNIVVLSKDGKRECWGSLKEICEEHKDHKFSYNYLKSKSYPFEYKGFTFERFPFRVRTIK